MSGTIRQHAAIKDWSLSIDAPLVVDDPDGFGWAGRRAARHAANGGIA